MEHRNLPVDRLPPAFGQIIDSLLETRAQANTALDKAIAEMKEVKDTTLAEFNIHKTTL